MELKIKTFRELEKQELYDLLQLRSEIFVVEQACLYQDMDGKDQNAIHVLGYIGEQLVAYSRLFGPGTYFTEASIGRVAVRVSHRGKGLGVQIMKRSVEAAEAAFHTRNIALSAQLYLKEFYEDLGFCAEGPEYEEDGIPHIRMVMHP